MAKKNSAKALQNFTPSAPMKKWLATSFDLGYGASIVSVAKSSGVTRQSWYSWLENDEFVKWWDRMWQKHLLGMRWRLDAIGMKKAEKDYTYWQDMMKRVGNLPEEPEAGPNIANVNVFRQAAENAEKFIVEEEEG